MVLSLSQKSCRINLTIYLVKIGFFVKNLAQKSSADTKKPLGFYSSGSFSIF